MKLSIFRKPLAQKDLLDRLYDHTLDVEQGLPDPKDRFYWIGTLPESGERISQAVDPPMPEFRLYDTLEEAEYALDQFLAQGKGQ